MDRPLYLDYNASAPLDPRVWAAMAPYWEQAFGNSRSGHAFGQAQKAAVEQARAQVAAFLGCEPDEVTFTSGGSEANNLAIKGLAWARPARQHLVRAALEHYSVAYAMDFLAGLGRELTVLGVDRLGRVAPEAVEAALRPETLMVAVQHANNEIGTVQPVAEIAERTTRHGVPLFCDAAQSAGKLPIDVRAMGVDLLSIAGHKFCGPAGVGALYRRRGIELVPLVHGAGHEDGLRSGTHAVPLIVGLGAACELAGAELAGGAARMAGLRDRLYEKLRGGVPGLQLNGDPDHRLPHTLNVSFPGVDGTDVLEGAPGVAATTGAACHSGSREPSAALQAIGAPREIGLGAVRLSLGRFTTEAEVDAAAELLAASWRALAGTPA